MSIAIVAGSELVLIGRYAVELTVEPKGVDWTARATVRLHGDIVNIVERDYYYGSATMHELRTDMLDLAGYAVDDDYHDANHAIFKSARERFRALEDPHYELVPFDPELD